MNYQALAKQVLTIEKEAIQGVSDRLDEQFDASIKTLLSALQKKGKIVVIGIGKSGNIGHKIAATFNSTGATAVVLNSQNALHGDLGIISDGDVILAMSYSGETIELLDILPHIKRFDVNIIALTGNPDSTLAKHADHLLNSEVEQEACPLNLAPTSSSTAMLALGDALAMVLLNARGFNADDFAKFHPGGSLGRILLTKVDDIMRGHNRMAILKPTSTVHEALKAMSDKKSGACVITNNDSTLLGIFTHGDFVRAFQNNPALGEQSLSTVMTQNPIQISSGELAMSALKVLEKHAIDDVIVVDNKNQPIGLIDSQDFARNRLY